jgi:hypothetical protein
VTTIAGVRNSLQGPTILEIRRSGNTDRLYRVTLDCVPIRLLSASRHVSPEPHSHDIPGAAAFSCGDIGWRSEVSSERELIDTAKHKRFVAPRASGQFKESDDVGRSLNGDRQQKAKRKVKSGQGDRGDR